MTTPAGAGNNVTPISPNAAAWGTTSGAPTRQPYSVNNFYCAASDANGYEVLRIKVPTWIVRELAALPKSDDFPVYNSQADFVRDALVHRVHKLRDLAPSPEMRRLLQEAEAIALAEQRVLNVKIMVDRMQDHAQNVVNEMERNDTLELWDLQATLIHDTRAHMDIANWTGRLYTDLNAHLDHYEAKIPEAQRKPYHG